MTRYLSSLTLEPTSRGAFPTESCRGLGIPQLSHDEYSWSGLTLLRFRQQQVYIFIAAPGRGCAAVPRLLPTFAAMSSSQPPFLPSSPLSLSAGQRRKSRFTYKHLSLLSQSSPSSPLRVISHIDLDAFYAQCEGVRLNIAEDQPLAVQVSAEASGATLVADPSFFF